MSGSNNDSPNISISDVRTATQLLLPDAYNGALKCSSAPSSRSGSFKKARRAADFNDGPRSSLPSLEDSIIAKLQELKQLEADQCCVVRQFVTSPRGLVNRGDSFRKQKRLVIGHKMATAATPQTPVDGEGQGRPSGGLSRLPSVEKLRRVVIVGERGVGKTALMQQFMTSQYMAAMNTSFDVECSKTLSVSLNGEETLINFTDVDTSDGQDFRQLYDADVDCFVLLFSITDRKSYNCVTELMTSFQRRHGDLTAGVILVANKSDLVRKRQVTDREAKELCGARAWKYVSVSAVLNHKVDDLLVGIVTQIRLRHQPRDAAPVKNNAVQCMKSSKGLLERLLTIRFKDTVRPCENLSTL